jgi:hypothetical protein
MMGKSRKMPVRINGHEIARIVGPASSYKTTSRCGALHPVALVDS